MDLEKAAIFILAYILNFFISPRSSATEIKLEFNHKQLSIQINKDLKYQGVRLYLFRDEKLAFPIIVKYIDTKPEIRMLSAIFNLHTITKDILTKPKQI